MAIQIDKQAVARPNIGEAYPLIRGTSSANCVIQPERDGLAVLAADEFTLEMTILPSVQHQILGSVTGPELRLSHFPRL